MAFPPYKPEEAMAPHSSTLAWKIPWMEELGGLQSMGSRRVGHWVTSLSLFCSCIGEGNGNPLQCSCLENPRDGGAWLAAVYGVAQSRTRLKQLAAAICPHLILEALRSLLQNFSKYIFTFPALLRGVIQNIILIILIMQIYIYIWAIHIS